MSSQEIGPKWWQLYLVFPLLIALFMVDFRLQLSERGHQVVQIGILLIVYGLAHLWLKANAAALSKIDQKQFNRAIIVTRVPSYQPSDINSDKRPMFQFPNFETKGTLSDTFEMDYIDAEFFSVDVVPQELNEE